MFSLGKSSFKDIEFVVKYPRLKAISPRRSDQSFQLCEVKSHKSYGEIPVPSNKISIVAEKTFV